MNKSNRFGLLIIFLIAFSVFYFNQYTPWGDDLCFSKVATENLASDPLNLKWLQTRYFTWSSRTWIEFSLVNVINHFSLWCFISALTLSSLIFCIGSIFSPACNFFGKLNFSFLSLLLLACMPKEVLSQSIVWMTGAVNYLWPSALAFVGFYSLIRIIRKKENPQMLNFICYTSIVLSSFNEQIVIVNLIFCLFLLFFYKKNNYRLRPIVVAGALSLLVLIFILTCPGNKVRYYSEITSWFKDYGSLNLFKRALFGLNLYADMLFANKTLIPTILAFSLSLICKTRIRLIPLISAFFLVSIFLLTEPPHIFQRIQFNVNNIVSTVSILRVSAALILTGMILIPVAMSLRHSTALIFILSMIIGCIASVSILGFSPTVYASSYRVYYIPYLALISAALSGLQILFQESKKTYVNLLDSNVGVF